MAISSTSRVIAMLKTPSLNASMRRVDMVCVGAVRPGSAMPTVWRTG